MTTTTEKYRPIAKLGAGGMASVELAVMSGSGGIKKLLVVKKLLAHLAQDPSYVAMFVNEARVAARLSHPNVVSTYEVGSDGAAPFIVMEYLEGQALSAIFRRVGRPHVTLPHQLHVLRGILAGLEYAHTLIDFDGRPLGLVHRDVSPQNAFVCYDGRVKLVDFGIAKINGLEGESEGKPGVLKGKIAYMAPEQLRGDAVDGRADVYSVGIMLWEALARRRMTLGEAEATVVGKRKRGDIPDLALFNPLAPAPLTEVCTRALAFAAEDRFPSAGAMLTALDEAILASGQVAVERELGVFVAESFVAERARIQSVIETQLKTFTISLAGPAALPELERMESSLGGTVITEDGKATAPPSSGPVSASPAGGLNGEVSTPPLAEIVAAPFEQPRRKRALGGATLMIVAALATGGWFAAHREPSPPPTASGMGVATLASETPAPAHVTLILKATPDQARFVLDGRRLPGNPTTIQVLKDGKKHQLHVEAGHASADRSLTYDRDQTIHTTLAAAATPPTSSDSASELAPSARTHEAGAPLHPAGRPARPHRTLDEQNPY